MDPITQVADHRQAGTLCPGCKSEIQSADLIVICPDCGAAHHQACWEKDGCSTYYCAPAQHNLGEDVTPAIVIGRDDLDRATSPRMASPVARLHSPAMIGQNAPSLPNAFRQPMSRFAIVAFLVSLIGVPLVGIMLLGPTVFQFFPFHIIAVVTGLIAVVLGAIAVGHIQVKRRRGTLFAVCGVFIGLADMVGWIMVLMLSMSFGGGHRVAGVQFSHEAPDLTTIAAMPEVIQQAMRANVVVTSNGGWGPLAQSLGSGVIVQVDRARAYILTNRHVIDLAYNGSSNDKVPKDAKVQVEMLGQTPRDAVVHWVAPHGIDVALISTDLLTSEAVAAKWKKDNKILVGNNVFGIGNPCDLAWTQTRGSVSQIRKQTTQGKDVAVIQTDVAVSSGNSGGGLYDDQGFLIGLNTWTTDKKIAEGLSFAISIDSILDLKPPIPEKEKEETPQYSVT